MSEHRLSPNANYLLPDDITDSDLAEVIVTLEGYFVASFQGPYNVRHLRAIKCVLQTFWNNVSEYNRQRIADICSVRNSKLTGEAELDELPTPEDTQIK